MAIGTPTTLLSTGSGTSAASYTTASVAPAANSALLLWVSSALTGGAEGPTTVTGLGLTWTKATDQDSNNLNLNGSLWTAKTSGTAPTPGALTIAFATARGNAGWLLIAVPNATPASNVITTSTASLNPTATLPSPPASASAVFAFLGYNASTTNTMTPGAALTKLGTDANTPGAPANQLSAAWDAPASPTQTVSYATTNGSNKVIAGIEVTGDYIAPAVTLAAGSQLDTVLIESPAAGAGTPGFTYAITEVDLDGQPIAAHGEFYARPHGATGRAWVVPQNTETTYWRVTATDTLGLIASQTYAVPGQSAGQVSNLFLQTANDGLVPITLG